jgi:hypothetical protein
MPRRNSRSASGSESTSNNQAQRQQNESLPQRTRRIADRICQLPHEVVASFALSEPRERASRLQRIEAELSFDMLPVISWLERHRTPDKAYLVKLQLSHVLRDAVRCTQLVIPEYSGGVVHRQSGDQPASEGAQRTAELAVTAKAFATTLWEWADEIAAEEMQRSPQTELTDRHRDILQVLLEKTAFDIDHRLTTDEITEAVCGEGRGNPDSFKRPVRELKTRGLVDTKRGSSGGVWLTDAGRRHIEQVRQS